MKIYIIDPIHDLPLSYARKIGEIITWDNPKIEDLSEAEALLVRTTKITREDMLKCPNLKVIAKHGIGIDNIDVKSAKELGIIVTNTPHANIRSVSEMAVSLILSIARNIPRAFDMIRDGHNELAPKELTGVELEGKTVGLIGLGKIGLNVGAILKDGFNMNLVGFDPYLNHQRAQELGIKKYDDLREMLKISDVVSISVPLLPSTINLIGKDEFEIMKKTAILVNTSRGKIVNEADLYEALSKGKIRGAALDVFEIEPPTNDNPLFSLKNFVGTSHIAAATEESLIKMGQTAIEEIIRVRDRVEPLYVVK